MSNSGQTRWVCIDNALLDKYGPIIGAYGIAVYTVLASHANEEGECWPSIQRIGKLIKANKRRVLDTVKLLEQSGLIIVYRMHEPGKLPRNIYTLDRRAFASAHAEPFSTRAKSETTIPQPFDLSVEDIQWASSLGMDNDGIEHESMKFVEFYRSRNLLRADWLHAWRLWILRTQPLRTPRPPRHFY